MDHWALYRNRKKGAVKADEAGYFEYALTTERNANIIKSLYLLLAYEAHMKSSQISVTSIKHIKIFMPYFLDQVLRAFNREEGTKNNTVKNHLPLHYAEDIARFGCAQNFNSGTGEMILKPFVKETGRRTNMHASSFERQTARRYIENIAISRAKLEYEGNKFAKKIQDQVCFLNLVISQSTIKNKRGKKVEKVNNWKDSYIGAEEVVRIVRQIILPKLSMTSEISLYSRVLISGQAYNANPSATQSCESKQEWAYVNMGHDGVVPCQLLCVLNIPENPQEVIHMNNSVIDAKGTFFLVHTALTAVRETGESPYYTDNQNEGTLAHVDQRLVHRIPKGHLSSGPGGSWKRATSLYPATTLFVDAKSIVSPCLAIPDILSDDSENDFFIIRAVKDWAGLFEEEARKHARENC